MKNKIAIFLGVALSVAILSSCGYEKINTQKEKDMDFTVVSQGEMPDEVKQIVEERKENIQCINKSLIDGLKSSINHYLRLFQLSLLIVSHVF